MQATLHISVVLPNIFLAFKISTVMLTRSSVFSWMRHHYNQPAQLARRGKLLILLCPGPSSCPLPLSPSLCPGSCLLGVFPSCCLFLDLSGCSLCSVFKMGSAPGLNVKCVCSLPSICPSTPRLSSCFLSFSCQLFRLYGLLLHFLSFCCIL